MFAQNDSTSPEADDQGPSAPAGKRLFGVGMLAVGIAAGAMFAPASFAGAQDDETDGDTTETDPAETESERSSHRNHRGDVLESLGIDAEAVQAGRDADQSLVQIAEANGVSEADLVAAIEADITAHIADAVDSGRLTQEAADEKLAELPDKITERINTLPSELPERGHRSNRGDFRGGEVLEELGLTVEDIQAGREAGQTLTQTAEANGVSEADLVDALVAQAPERAEAAVEEGRIDTDRAAEILDGLDDRIAERVNAEPGERGERGRRGQRGGGEQADAEEAVASF